MRKDEIDADQLAALAVVDDYTAQEKAFFDAPAWARTPHRLKAQLLQTHVPETDKLACFVGVEAYGAAGGAATSELFNETGANPMLWLTDSDLLMRLAVEKLEPIAEKARGEGWAWVE
ncbi:MAG: chromosome partitioning protein ParB, partial [Xanthomonadales bacterium]|nr:chromosome partitioning protein ParB [Xanthomonadales bacterium]